MKTKPGAWQTFFDQHASRYMEEPFTRNTGAEVEFLVDEFGLPPGSHILDVGCGTGRHAVGLARLGYRLTGVDLSAGMLAEARQAADEAGVQVEWVQADALQFEYDRRFDGIICLCEGAFGLLGSLDDPLTRDLALLRRIQDLLVPGGKLILTALNGLAMARKATPETVAQGAFNPHTTVEVSEMEYESADGEGTLTVRERGFTPSELTLMCRVAGFDILHVYGGTAGAWNRRPVELDEIEIMVIARRRTQACGRSGRNIHPRVRGLRHG